MRLQFGMTATKIPMPEAEGCFISVRKLDWDERDEYERLQEEGQHREAARYLVTHMVTGFRLPGPNDPIVSAPDDRAHNERVLRTADDEMRAWMLRQCYEAAGETARLKLMDIEEAGHRFTEESWRDVLDEVKRRADERLSKAELEGNSSGSPAPGTEDGAPPSSESSSDAPTPGDSSGS